MAVYPNPNQGLFSVEIMAGQPATASLRIVNSLGIPVYAENGITVETAG